MTPKPKKSEGVNTTKKWTCDVCSKLSGSNAELIRHVRTHTGEKPYHCLEPGCKKSFAVKSSLTSHKNFVHSVVTVKAFKCNVPECGKAFTHDVYLTYHLKSHDLSKVPCPICNKSVRKVRLTGHVRAHNKHKTFACDLCEIKVSSAAKLKHHIAMLHSTDWKTFDCTYCEKRCNQLKNFNSHLRTHTGETPFSCTQCDKKYKSDGALLLHVKSAHSGEAQEFACTECPKKFFFKAKLNRHMSVHNKDVGKKHACPICDKKFSEKGQVNSHMSKHTGEKPFTCKECPKCFGTAGGLSIHIKKWHSGLPRASYKCGFCDKAFREKSYWKVHQETHSVPSVTCEQCGKQYTNRMMLASHIRRQHGVRVYRFHCSFCSSQFLTKDAMNRHIRRHVGEKPNVCTYIDCQMRFLHKYELESHLLVHLRKTGETKTTQPRPTTRAKSCTQFQKLERINE